MAHILKHWKKNEVTNIGTDKAPMNKPTFEIINVSIDTKSRVLNVEIEHFEENGLQPHSRSAEKDFNSLPSSIKQAGKVFLDAIEQEILALPQYIGAVEQ